MYNSRTNYLKLNANFLKKQLLFLLCLVVVLATNAQGSGTGSSNLGNNNNSSSSFTRLTVAETQTSASLVATTTTAATSTKSHCDACFCRSGPNLICTRANRLSDIPILSKFDRQKVKEIKIENQANFTRLDNVTLKKYLEARKLTIQNTGLKHIAEDAFRGTKLKYITLRDNAIEHLSWRMFDGLELEELNIEGNPIPCDCSSKWIQHKINTSAGFPSGSWDKITCNSVETRQKEYISSASIPDCDVPNVTLEVISGGEKNRNHSGVFKEGQSVVLNCHVEASPKAKIFWRRRAKTKTTAVLNENDNSTKVIDTIGKMVSKTMNTLNLTKLRREDSKITCVAQNDVGETTEDVFFEVYAKPNISHLYQSTSINHVLNYVITGYPKPNRTWLFNGESMAGKIPSKDTAASYEPDVQRGTLELLQATRKNDGNYTLIVTNSEGTFSKSVEFKLPAVLDSVSASFDKSGPARIPPLAKTAILEEKAVQGESRNKFEENKYIIATVAVLVLVVILLALLLLRYTRLSRQDRKQPVLSKSEKIPLNAKSIIENPNYYESEERLARDWGVKVISNEKVNFIENLGEGAFGKVFLGTIDYLTPDEPTTFVAVKILKSLTEEDVRVDFKREAQLLSSLKHPNIVTFYGISLNEDNLMMLFEYMQYGDLNNFLQVNGPDSLVHKDEQNSTPKVELRFTDLLRVAAQIAKGMKYLSDQRFVHRDLATRNCLVGENMVVKIGDFGMSRDVYATDYYRVGRQAMLPVRWMAPETIVYRKFTIESDIWSFGVVLWEIFTYGKQPYYHLSNHEVIDYITSGNIPTKPDTCLPEVYEVMLQCFQQNPADRASFAELYHSLHTLIVKFGNDNYTSL